MPTNVRVVERGGMCIVGRSKDKILLLIVFNLYTGNMVHMMLLETLFHRTGLHSSDGINALYSTSTKSTWESMFAWVSYH